MDILKYMNSRDVADYLEKIGFEFNAMQAAYIIYINDRLTIDERIELWREIIDAMPDCEYERLFDEFVSIVPSAHAQIELHVEKVQESLRYFMTNCSADTEHIPALINKKLFESFRNEFEFFVPHIPIPFIQGEILADATCDSLPFVYDRCASWSIGERRVPTFGDGAHHVLVSDDEFDDVFMDRCGKWPLVMSLRNGHMRAFGYEIEEGNPDSLLCYSELGACDNYLNLEYYRGSFCDGNLAVLPTVSWFVMNETRDETLCDAIWERKYAAEKRFADRGMGRPDCGGYDICSLVNAGFRLRY